MLGPLVCYPAARYELPSRMVGIVYSFAVRVPRPALILRRGLDYEFVPMYKLEPTSLSIMISCN
jgi:hypothetical protein